MKSIGLGLLWLLFTVLASAEELEELQPLPDEAEPLPIFLYTYKNEDFALSAAFKMNWFEAQAACASEDGWTLVNLQSQSKQSRIYNFLVQSKQLQLLTEPIWTSGNNLANPKQWSWWSIGTSFGYNNFASRPSELYRCLGLNAVTGYWIPEDCTARRYFVCEKRCQVEPK